MSATDPIPSSSPLGWSVLAPKTRGARYPCGLARLSHDEQLFVLEVARAFGEWSKHQDLGPSASAQSVLASLAPAPPRSDSPPLAPSTLPSADPRTAPTRADPPSAPLAEQIERLLDAAALEQGLELDVDQRQYLLAAARAHLLGFAPLDQLLTDPDLEEVALIGLGQPVYVYHRQKGWLDSDAYVLSADHLVHLINKMARPLGRRVSAESPRLHALLPGGSRLHASIPPLSTGELTIRLHGSRAWSVADLLASRSINADALALLWLALQSDSSLLVVGNTASGKTTLLDALLGFVPLSERVLLIEETPELRPAHPHQVRLVCNPELDISMAELVRDSLRMRPDRVVVGEVRTPPEAQAYMETLLSGQARGSYATFHAQSAPEALRRLVNLGANPDDLGALDFLLVQRRIAHYDPKTRRSQELRRCLGLWMIESPDAAPPAAGRARSARPAHSAEPRSLISTSTARSCSDPLASLSSARAPPALVALLQYDPRADALRPTPALARGLARLADKMGLRPSQVRSLLSARSRFLRDLPPGLAPNAALDRIQRFAYR